MGAYVLRATNAHFKILDEGIQDSFQENITQANQNHVPYISTNCVCTNHPGSCSMVTGSSQCANDEIGYTHSCLPNQGCDGEPASFCQYDQDCCKQYYAQGCGLTTMPTTSAGYHLYKTFTQLGLPTSGLNPTSGSPGSCRAYYATTPSSCASNTDCPTGTICYIPTPTPTVPTPTGTCYYTSCYYGEQAYATQCSSLPVACCADTSCNPTCNGVNLILGSACYCQGSTASSCNDTVQPSPLYQSWPIKLVSESSCSSATAANPCSMFCNTAAGYLPSADGTSCIYTFLVAPSEAASFPSGANCNYALNYCSCDPDATPAGSTLDGPGCNGPGCNVQGCSCYLSQPGNPQRFGYGCGTNNNGKWWVTVNNKSFSVCPSTTNTGGVTIKTAVATPSNTSSSYACACCNDSNGQFQGTTVDASTNHCTSPQTNYQSPAWDCPVTSSPANKLNSLTCLCPGAVQDTQCRVIFTTTSANAPPVTP